MVSGVINLAMVLVGLYGIFASWVVSRRGSCTSSFFFFFKEEGEFDLLNGDLNPPPLTELYHRHPKSLSFHLDNDVNTACRQLHQHCRFCRRTS